MTDSEVFLVQLQNPAAEWVDVGLLRRSNNTNWYQGLDRYWTMPERPVLGQVFEENGAGWQPNAHVGLPRWFSHLLPEGQLRDAVAAASGINRERELQILVRLGADDLPGAIRVIPANEQGDARAPESLEPEAPESPQNPLLKFSLAGLQMKLSVHRSGRALTVPVSGQAGNHIMKLPDLRPGYLGVPEAEFAAMRLASASGINTAATELVDARSVSGIGSWADVPGKSLLVARYDRGAADNRVHAEEFAQILDIPTGRTLDARYERANFETIANVAAKLIGVDAVAEVIDRIVFNILIGNGDAHLKNWSVLYADSRTPSLSPAYDLVPTILYVRNDNLGLNLAKSKIFSAVVPSSFDQMGIRTGLGVAPARQAVVDAAERVMENWSQLSDTLTKAQFQMMNDHLATLALRTSK